MKISNGFFVLYLSFGLILFACGGGSSGGGGGGSGGGSAGGGGGGGGTASSNSTIRVSVSSIGIQGNSASSAPSISSDGRYIAFESTANNIVAGDTNGVTDIFVYDRNNETATRVSVDSSGNGVSGASSAPSICSDGRYVAFESIATNLTADDTNGAIKDIFVRDRNTSETTRVSVSYNGDPVNSASSAPSISSDGRYVAFESIATSLTADDTNGAIKDIFVRDRNTSETTRVSVSFNGGPVNSASSAPSISSDGRYVAFESLANNLVTGDANGVKDIFVYDRNTGTTTLVSVDSSGIQGNGISSAPFISSDGVFVVFESLANNLVTGDANGVKDIFVYDRNTGTTTLVSVDSSGIQGNGISSAPSISSDGVFVVFESLANNLVTGDANGVKDIFVYDRNTGTTIRVSVDSSGIQGNGSSSVPSVSSDGKHVTFESIATNLVTDDTNGLTDIFVNGP